MAIKVGPVLRLRGCDLQKGIWSVCILVCVDENDAQPALTADIDGTTKAPAAKSLWAFRGFASYRYDLEIPLGKASQVIKYRIAGTGDEWKFAVPALEEQPRFAYVSCNGFSSFKLMKSIQDKNRVWKHIAQRHEQKSYHVLLMGGDQVYADSMWEMVEPLRAWNHLAWEDSKKAVEPPELADALLKHFFDDMYCQRWSQPEVRAMLAQIPTIMMWDDHDIMDGWGSYPDDWLDSKVYQRIFDTARRCFEMFQLQGTNQNEDGSKDYVYLPDLGKGYHQLYTFTNVTILIPDLRSERRLNQVLSPASWEAIYAALDGVDRANCRHLLVMSSIPVMHARFGQIETILGWVPGQQELEDDLHDHWSSRPHRAERLRLIHRLFDFSQQRKTRVTIVSGDVHVAAHASILSDRDGAKSNDKALVQLTSSAVVHPAPPAAMRFALNHLFTDDEEIDRGITGHMEKMPGDERRYIPARNWLAIEPDDDGGRSDDPRLWANWFVEEDQFEHPFTRVIHPVC